MKHFTHQPPRNQIIQNVLNAISKKRHLNTLLSFSAFSIIAAIAAACTLSAEELPPAKKAVVVPGIPVDATVVKPGVVTEQLVVTGTILANQHVDIVSELTRRIISVHVKEGSKVKKGTLLFQLDNADLLAQLERLRQQEKLALLNEKRLKDLVENDAIAQQDYDEAETNLKVLQAQVRELQTTIDKTSISAPFDGQIGMINVHPGAVVSVNTTLTNIEDNSVVKVEFSVPEKYTNIVRVGSEQSFTTPADKSEFKSRIIAKAARLSTDTRSLLVRGIANNPDGKLVPGQSARVALSLSTSDHALAVSSQALIPSPGGYSVFISQNGSAKAIPVEIGQRNTGTVEITKGLSAGDTIIISNLPRLSPGTLLHFASVN